MSRPSVDGAQTREAILASLQNGRYLAEQELCSSDNRILFQGHQPALDRPILIERVTGLTGPTLNLALAHKSWVLSLIHINIAQCLDVFVEDDALYTVMAAGSGELLAHAGQIPAKLVAAYGVQICNALNYLQLCPDCAAHCTIIDPTTVFVTEAHRARLTPMAALLGVTDAHSSSRYAPSDEQGVGADVFCVGATLHHALTGWEGDYAAGAPAITHVAPEMNAAIMKALTPDPADRFASIAELRYALLRLE